MNKREAKAYALRVLAAETRHHLDNGSEWIECPLRDDGVAVDEEGRFSEADSQRVRDAVLEISEELDRRAKRLGEPKP